MSRVKQSAQLQKTVMCRFHMAGNCRKGALCGYAHGTEDLRVKPDLQCTSMCPAVLQKGSCDNPNCRYAHDNAELRTTSVFFKSKMCMFATRGRCKNGDACRFAHTDEDLIEPQVPNGLDAETQPGNRQDASNAMAKAMQKPPHANASGSDARQRRNAKKQGGTGGWPESDSSSGNTSTQNSHNSHPPRQHFQGSPDRPETSSSAGHPDSLVPNSTPEGTSDSGSSDSQQQHSRIQSPNNKGDTGGAPRSMNHLTTVMMMNVPCFLTQGSLVSLLEDLSPCMCGTFDFFYCPWDPAKDSNLGYAIINFFSGDCAAEFEQEWSKKHLLAGCRGSKRLRIVPATLQGRDVNIQYFATYDLAQHSNPRFRPLIRASSSDPLRPIPVVQRAPEDLSHSAQPRRPGPQPNVGGCLDTLQPHTGGQQLPFHDSNVLQRGGVAGYPQSGLPGHFADSYSQEAPFVRQYPPVRQPASDSLPIRHDRQPVNHPTWLRQALHPQSPGNNMEYVAHQEIPHQTAWASAPEIPQQTSVQTFQTGPAAEMALQRDGYRNPQVGRSQLAMSRMHDTGYYSEYSD